MVEKERASLNKKLIYQSNYMGCRENDIIFGRFAKKNLSDLSDEEILLYQELLGQEDLLLFSWLTKQVVCPTRFQQLIAKIYKSMVSDE
jgi:antitoxin CptB